MAVWEESDGSADSGPWRAMAAEYHAATDTWETPVIISELTTPYDIQNWLRLAGDGRGNYVAAWQQDDGSDSEVWVNVYDADLGWQGPEIIGTGTTWAYDPEVSMTYDPVMEETKAVVAWGYDGNVLISRLTNFSEGIWSSPDIAGDVADSLNPMSTVVDMAVDGDFLMLFETYDTYDLYYRHYDWDEGWTGSVSPLETRSEWTILADLAMNSSGVAVATWSQRTGANDTFEIWARHWNGTDWSSTPELVTGSQDGRSAILPIVSVAENDEAIVFWRQRRDDPAFVDAYVRHFDGEQWSTSGGLPEIITVDAEDLGDVGAGPFSGPEAFNWSMAMDDTGNAIASWTQDDGTNINLWSARFDRASSTWATAEKIEDAPLAALRPVVAMNGTGDNQIIWTQSDGTLNHIYAATIPEPGNLPPTANPDSASTLEDVAVTIDIVTLLANDTDPDLDPISITGFGSPSNGSLVDNGNGSVTYTPDADFNGSDSFTYTINDGRGGTDTATVNVTVTSVPDDPVAVNDTATTEEDTAFDVMVLDNDYDADDDTLSVVSVTQPSNGVVVNNGSSVTYTPNAGYIGNDLFTYTVSDGNGGTDTGNVSINVSAANSDVALYVYDIRFESKRGNKDWRAVFEIRSDSNADGQGGAADAVASGVTITVEFAGQTYTGTTDADGVFRTSWIKDLSSGSHYAEAVDLVLANCFWNPLTLDLEDDLDGDGLPDDVLVR